MSEVLAALGGIRYLGLPKLDLIARSILETGSFELGVIELAKNLISQQPPGTVIDVGANLGSFVIPLALAAPQCEYLCFEAQRLVAYQLCGTVALNGLANVVVHHAAAGDVTGAIDFDAPDYSIETNIGAMSLDATTNQLRGATTKGDRERVHVLKLDSLPISDLRLIKIDVEGMEMAVLRGALILLERNGYPPILGECWAGDWYAEPRAALFALLDSIGYQVVPWGDNFIASHAAG